MTLATVSDPVSGIVAVRRVDPWVLVAGGFHERGGMDRANAALLDALLERRTPVHLVAHDVAEQYARHPLVTVHKVARPLDSFFLGERLLRGHGASVARAVLDEYPGARVVTNGGACAWPGTNWVHYVHHVWDARFERAPLWFRLKTRAAGAIARRDEKTALGVATCVVANSERTRRDVIEHLGVDPAAVHTVYLGSDPDWGPPTHAERQIARASFGSGDGRPIVAFVGALGYDRRKGFDTLWSAWESLCTRTEWDADLVVAGGGNALGYWRDVVRRAGLENRVRLLGFTGRVRDLLAAADLLVSPARYESYGLNVQEALCRGVPALVSRHAGVVERFPPEFEDLTLIDPESVAELVARLRRWRADVAGWRERAGVLGYVLRGYTWRNMARDLVAVIDVAEAGGPTLASRFHP